jgi:L-lysine exporter family protein LysE/ArgO
MSFLLLGFVTGLSLILALGAQNIFVIEQGLKKNYIFLVCIICSFSDLLLIFLGIFIFNIFQNFLNIYIEITLNFLLLFFLTYFIWSKIKTEIYKINFNSQKKIFSLPDTILKTLSFTYLNPHVYSDTLFFLGNFSKNFSLDEKLFFGLGASISSFLFFFTLGYLSKYLSNYLKDKKIWKFINIIIVLFMSFLLVYVLVNIINLL